MQRYKVGDKVHIIGKPDEMFTIGEVLNDYFYCFDDEEVAHLYLDVPNYENIYFAGDLSPVSI
jgi:hypothetical protein